MLWACTETGARGRTNAGEGPDRERVALGASFTGQGPGDLPALLHADVIVQPPEPDSARRGSEAAAYLARLASHTAVTESRLEPSAAVREGVFLFEQGTWLMRSGDLWLRSRYALRWRRAGDGWQVVLWRWTLFR